MCVFNVCVSKFDQNLAIGFVPLGEATSASLVDSWPFLHFTKGFCGCKVEADKKFDGQLFTGSYVTATYDRNEKTVEFHAGKKDYGVVFAGVADDLFPRVWHATNLGEGRLTIE